MHNKLFISLQYFLQLIQYVTIPQDPQQIVDMIYQDVMDGKIQESRIDEAYQRIKKLKNQLINLRS